MKKILTVVAMIMLMVTAYADPAWMIPEWTMASYWSEAPAYQFGYGDNVTVSWANLQYWKRDGDIIVDIHDIDDGDSEKFMLVIYDGRSGVLQELETYDITNASQEYLDEILFNLKSNAFVEHMYFEDTWTKHDIDAFDSTEKTWIEKAWDFVTFWN